MKHTMIAALLALLLLLLPLSAMCEERSPAQTFADLMLSYDISCTCHPADASGSEYVTVPIDDESIGLQYAIRIRFDPSGETAVLTVPDIFTFSDVQLDGVLRACNTLNCSFMYTRFIVNELDRTVSVSLDLLLGRQDPLAVVFEAFERMHSIVREAYPSLIPFTS